MTDIVNYFDSEVVEYLNLMSIPDDMRCGNASPHCLYCMGTNIFPIPYGELENG